VRDPWADLRRATRDSVLAGPGAAPSELRQRVARGDAPADLAPVVEKIRKYAYRVTDDDLGSLAKSYDEDQLFEIVLAAAIGAAGDKLDRAMALLEELEAP
jgi:hypothetical protein